MLTADQAGCRAGAGVGAGSSSAPAAHGPRAARSSGTTSRAAAGTVVGAMDLVSQLCCCLTSRQPRGGYTRKDMQGETLAVPHFRAPPASNALHTHRARTEIVGCLLVAVRRRPGG